MHRLTVSVVMPNYNHETFLDRSLGAVLAQQLPPDEIIIVDDASTDGSVERIERMIAGFTNVRLVRNAVRSGAVAALEQGLRMATGELIAFPAADDLIFDSFLDVTEALLRANPEAAFACGAADIRDEDDRHLGRRPVLWPTLTPRFVPPSEARAQLVRGDNFFLGAVTLYRRSAMLEAGGFDAALGSLADGMMQRRLAVHHGYCFVPRTLGVWRHHQSNYSITSVTDPDYLRRLLIVARERIDDEPEGRFPPGYGALFARRLAFSAARLVLIGSQPAEAKASRVAGMLDLGATGEQILLRLLALGAAGHWLALVWLTLRQRPFSLAWLSMEPWRRLLAAAIAR